MSHSLVITQFGKTPAPAAPQVHVVSSHHLPVKARPSYGALVLKHVRAHAVVYSRIAVVALVTVNIVLLGVHVVQANTYAVAGYQLTQLHNKIGKLEEENKKLTLQMAESNSIAQVESVMQSDNFVPVTTTQFIRTTPVHVSER